MKANCMDCGKEIDYTPILFSGYDLGMKVCDECRERRIKEAEKKAREENRKVRMARFYELVPPVYQQSDINRLPCSQNVSEAVLSFNINNGRGLIIHGETGKGKTRLLCLLIKNLCEKGIFPYVFWAGDAERAVACAFDAKGGYEALFNKASKAKVLCFDDLGKDKISERYESFLFQLIEYRTSHLLPTIITTNSIGRTLVARFTDAEKREPFIRRLKEFFDIVGV